MEVTRWLVLSWENSHAVRLYVLWVFFFFFFFFFFFSFFPHFLLGYNYLTGNLCLWYIHSVLFSAPTVQWHQSIFVLHEKFSQKRNKSPAFLLVKGAEVIPYYTTNRLCLHPLLVTVFVNNFCLKLVQIERNCGGYLLVFRNKLDEVKVLNVEHFAESTKFDTSVER